MDYDVVSKAEEVIKSIGGQNPKRPGKLYFKLTKSKIRKFLVAVNSLKNKVDLSVTKGNSTSERLCGELVDEIKFLQVNIAYQAGREKAVEEFAEKAKFVSIIKDIGDSTVEFYKFCKYVEALVAYHKYYGGED